ncbi:uncharacterized protein LOC122563085 isoform X2 [Chiloscyllium plagiosum]|uniref:uncharacterized protein LOC122563085 isoform X2 n=1 Tax=Chiloscyllium plagiosum TaxID=36176 RepID=UPI001CB80A00|nr:uncharacterized protein LOC122563085 isoform X2 [Chiloscyllium plagiosum]
MKTIGFFILISVSSSHQLTGPKEVRGEVGGSVTVDCRYDQKYKEHKKQWSPTWGSTMGPTSSTAGTTQPPVTTALTMSSSTISSPRDGLMRAWAIIRWLIFAGLAVCSVSITCYTRFQTSQPNN